MVSFHRNSSALYNVIPRSNAEFEDLSDLDEEDQIIISELTKKETKKEILQNESPESSVTPHLK